MDKDKHNWHLILQEIKDALVGGCEPTLSALGRELGMPRTTLQDGLRRNFGIKAKQLGGLVGLSEDKSKVTKKKGLTYKTTEDDD